MAHKTLINGTAYALSGGKTIIDSTAYRISGGKTLVDGTGCSLPFGAPLYDPVLENNSWDQISAAADAGIASSLWSVGDCKQIILNGNVGENAYSNYSICVFIIGFDHNSSKEGQNRIHFQFAKEPGVNGRNICLVDNNYRTPVSGSGFFTLNTTNSCAGGWSASHMRSTICGTDPASCTDTLIGALPSDLRAVLKPVTKYTDNTGSGGLLSDVTATTDYMFLLSEYEVFGSVLNANTFEPNFQEQYEFYADGNSALKYYPASFTVEAPWWLRSPAPEREGYFACVGDQGDMSRGTANNSFGLAPGFCV